MQKFKTFNFDLKFCWNWWFFHYEKIMRFKKWPQLAGAGRTRAGHYHGSHTLTSPEAVLLGKMAYHPKHFCPECIRPSKWTNIDRLDNLKKLTNLIIRVNNHLVSSPATRMTWNSGCIGRTGTWQGTGLVWILWFWGHDFKILIIDYIIVIVPASRTCKKYKKCIYFWTYVERSIFLRSKIHLCSNFVMYQYKIQCVENIWWKYTH